MLKSSFINKIEALFRPVRNMFASSSPAVDATDDGDSSPEEKSMMKGVATFGEKEVSDVMRPRVSMFSLSIETSYENLLPQIIENGFSRIPVYGKDLDDVRGILYVKDLLPHIKEKDFVWQSLIRPAYFVPENKKIDDLFQDFRKKKIHIAIVVDEYGGTSGLVTLEDIVEEIVGDISDEFDKEAENDICKKIDDNTYIFKAHISLIDFCKVFEIDDDYFEEIEGESDSLAGVILEMESRIPEVGFKCAYKDFTFEIVEADNKHIIKIKVTYKEGASDEK